MTTYYKYDTCYGPHVLVRRNSLGWGGVVKTHTDRQWAAFVDGNLIRTKGGAIRTFSSREAAAQAAIKETTNVA